VLLPCSGWIEPFRKSPRTLTYGFFTQGTYPRHRLYSLSGLYSSSHSCPPPSPASSPLPSSGHAAFTALSVLLGGPTPHPASLPTSLFAYRVAYSVATQKPGEVSRGHTWFFRTVLSAHTLVRRGDENAFASIVQARPVPVFGRPVHPGFRLRLRPGTSPHALRISPRGEHPALRWFLSPPASETLLPLLDMVPLI